MKADISTLTRIAVALSAALTFVAAHDGAAARDRGYDGSGFVVRDHRMPPVVRDHRAPVVVRDHRMPPTVRDRRVPRGSQGGVAVTSSGSRRGGSPCIRSVFGGPCFGL
jgi:anti-sigma regulatory factor (Ser/Thr protein kinase)